MADIDAEKFKRTMLALINGKRSIKNALIAKGINVSGVPLSGYAALILAYKQSGGGGGGGSDGGGSSGGGFISAPITGSIRKVPISSVPNGVFLTNVWALDPWPMEFLADLPSEAIQATINFKESWGFKAKTVVATIENCPSDEYIELQLSQGDTFVNLLSTSASDYQLIRSRGGNNTYQLKQAFTSSTGAISIVVSADSYWDGMVFHITTNTIPFVTNPVDMGVWGEAPPPAPNPNPTPTPDPQPVGPIGTGWRCGSHPINVGTMLSVDACKRAAEAYLAANAPPGFTSNGSAFYPITGLDSSFTWDGTTEPIQFRATLMSTTGDVYDTFSFSRMDIYPGDVTYS